MKFLHTLIFALVIISPFTEVFAIRLQLRSRSRSRSLHKAGSKSRDVEQELRDIRFLEEKMKESVKRPSRRWTKDGRLCASAFVQDGKTFTDCTTTKSPDGKLNGKEWCYADPNAGGNPNWAYCKPILDYDRVRMRARDLMLELIVEIRRVAALVYEQIAPCARTISLLELIVQKQSAVDARINIATKKVETLFTNYQILLQLKTEWEKIDVEIDELQREVDALTQSNEDGSYSNNPKNCEGILGYESEASGDGLFGEYFNNEDFVGQALKRKDEEVDMDWDTESPAPGINYENFSIRWTSYIRAPVKGKYRFYTQSDDGNLLKVNGVTVISHFMGESNKDGGNWLEASKGNRRKVAGGKDIQNEKNIEADKVVAESSAVFLNAGMKYKVEYSMFHSVHNEEKETGLSFAKLYWASDEISQQIIKQQFLYTENKIPPIKISGINPETMRLSTCKEGDNAFRDSELWKIGDIPFQFDGMPAIKFNQEYSEHLIEFTSTVDIIVYIAIEAKRNSPIPSDFDDTQEFFSVMRVKPNQSKKSDGTIKASESLMYKIYKKKYSQGTITIPLVLTTKAATAHMILLYSLDPAASSPIACGGLEYVLSNPSSDAFDSCSVSSKLQGEGWTCESAFSGNLVDTNTGAWATNNQGVGAWLELKLKGTFQISKLEFKNRANPSERNSKLEVTFGNDNIKKEWSLKNIDETEVLVVSPPIVASSVKFTIKSVYGTMNNGGSFNVYGVKCVDPNKAENSQSGNDPMAELKNQLFKLSCEDTLSGKDIFNRLNLKDGDSLRVQCQETCGKNTINIFGDMIYSEDSSICKAATHSGALQKPGANVKLSVLRGESLYKSGVRNGVKSNSKPNTKLAMSFTSELDKNGNNQVVAGMKCDIYDKKLNKWMAGSLVSAEKIDEKFIKVTVSKEGYGAEFNEILTWPDPERVTYCGDRLKERECDKNSMNPNSQDLGDIKIAFGPGPLSVSGFVLDDGTPFGKKGSFEYGWSRDLKSNGRTRHINADPLLDSMILFTPHMNSKWCQESEPMMSCEPSEWSIKLKPGKYNVKLTVGDPAYRAQYNIQVNGKDLVKKILEPNQFFTPSDDFQIMDGTLRLTSNCEDECKFSWSRISALMIKKISEGEPQGDKSDETTRLGCGIAYSGGKCLNTGDIENCIYDSPLIKNIQNCGGELHIVKVPTNYNCKDQVGKMKCIRNRYNTMEECNKACPGGKCIDNKCNLKEVKV